MIPVVIEDRRHECQKKTDKECTIMSNKARDDALPDGASRRKPKGASQLCTVYGGLERTGRDVSYFYAEMDLDMAVYVHFVPSVRSSE